MIRLTLLLVAALGVVFAVAGRDPMRPEGSDQPGDAATGIEVTRLDRPAPAAALTGPAGHDRASDLATAIPLDDQEAALRAALRATEQAQPPDRRPAAAEPQTAAAEPQTAAAGPDLPAATAPDLWYVTATRVNLRSGPSTATPVIGQVSRGQQALVLEKTPGGWYRIETPENGATGFVFGRFLSRVEPL